MDIRNVDNKAANASLMNLKDGWLRTSQRNRVAAAVDDNRRRDRMST